MLDEATAFADPENEVLIQKAFTKLMEGRTVIMIAHRLSTVVGADRIIVLGFPRIQITSKTSQIYDTVYGRNRSETLHTNRNANRNLAD